MHTLQPSRRLAEFEALDLAAGGLVQFGFGDELDEPRVFVEVGPLKRRLAMLDQLSGQRVRLNNPFFHDDERLGYRAAAAFSAVLARDDDGLGYGGVPHEHGL